MLLWSLSVISLTNIIKEVVIDLFEKKIRFKVFESISNFFLNIRILFNDFIWRELYLKILFTSLCSGYAVIFSLWNFKKI